MIISLVWSKQFVFQLNVDAPYLLKKVIGIDYLLFRQKNTLDRANRTLRIDAWNESFNTRVEIQELCVYSVHPENPDWTCFEQSADLDIKSFFGFEGKIKNRQKHEGPEDPTISKFR